MDESLTNWYNDAVDKLPLMKELRENPDYVETKVYGNFSKEDKAQRLTSGPLSGASRLAFQVCDYRFAIFPFSDALHLH
jgi:hypothetical protein